MPSQEAVAEDVDVVVAAEGGLVVIVWEPAACHDFLCRTSVDGGGAVKKRPAARGVEAPADHEMEVEGGLEAECDEAAEAAGDQEPPAEDLAPPPKQAKTAKDEEAGSRKRKQRTPEELEVQEKLPVLERFRAPWILN